MPIYEFRCLDCRKKTTAIVLVRDRIGEVRCQQCGGDRLERLVSRFAIVKSEESRLDSLADPAAMAGVDENDPASVARWMKRMGQEMGEDFGDEIDQAMEEEHAGGAGGEDGPGADAGGDFGGGDGGSPSDE